LIDVVNPANLAENRLYEITDDLELKILDGVTPPRQRLREGFVPNDTSDGAQDVMVIADQIWPGKVRIFAR
jgi:hypothetical protein